MTRRSWKTYWLGLSAIVMAHPAHAADADPAQAAYLVVLLVILLSALLINWRSQFMTAVRYVALWALIVLGLVTAYAFRPEAEYIYKRVAGAAMPSRPISSGGGVETFRKANDGHFYITAELNGREVELMVDPGATVIVLPPDDAEALGIAVSTLRFNRPFETANGRVMGAMTRIETIRIGQIDRQDVPAAIVPDVGKPLLGMSYLATLSSYEFAEQQLTLKD